MKYRFSELVDIHSVRRLLIRFHRIAHVGCALYEADGNKLATSSWEPVCINFHRRNPHTRQRCVESDTILVRDALHEKRYAIYRCRNGMIDGAAPVMVAGEHVATVFSGQVFFDEPDWERFRVQAREFGFDEDRYLAALRNVPRIDRERLEPILEYLSEFAEFLGELGLRQMQQIEARETLQESERKLKTLSQSLLEKMETERHRLAYELHDQIGQALTAVQMNLESMRSLLRPAGLTGYLDEGIDVIDGAMEQVRNLSLNLRPAVLDDLGLVAALRWLVKSVANKGAFEVSFQSEDDEFSRLPKDTETACFRIAQEAITNVLRHARASKVFITLERNDQGTELTVCDDGVGFNVGSKQSDSVNGRGFGLLGMEERAALLGGICRIESILGKGSTVTAQFPGGR
jgi:signal transduction histidine kinase